MKGYLAILTLTLLITTSCRKNNGDSKAPQIAFLNMEPNTVRSGNSEDTVFISFRIADENADLGNPQTHLSPDSFDIYLVDSRGPADTTNIVTDTIRLYFPEIPTEAVNPSKPLEGMSIVAIEAAKFLYSREDSTRTRDTVRFDVFVKDKAMNVSNHFTTPEIYIER